ncbi:hypothetical protein BOX15_Mlig022043g1 [Macrostomum lignano]|uniref:Ion transport domain-containing protein n=1 Tax=Macrostomum lignano TaxID=282301 RepID=A0A267ES81_9PLAT|nr:hypothetical protein BOX15_Mlig022043g1 [Macrostomum lignano]
MSSLWSAYPSVTQLRQLLDDKAEDVDSRQNDRTLLHRAATDNKLEVIRLLKEHGADLNALNSAGKSALNLGLEKRHFETVELLLELGADPNTATVNTESTLHQAAAIKDSRFISRLLAHGAKCNAPDRLNDWPIHRASLEEYLETVGVLLHEHSEHINVIGNRGLTPLHIAATNSNAELFAVLVEHGADIAVKDLQGRTPLDLVIMNQDNAILDTYGYLLANKVVKCPEAGSFRTVFSTDSARKFLDTLTKIDNEYRRTFVPTDTDIEYFQNRLDEATNEMLLSYIESDERIDINEFVQIIIRAVSNGLVDEIISKDLVPKIAESIFRHVLVTENEILLQELMNLGVLWGKIVQFLESNIVEVYEKTLIAKRVGIRGLVWRECLKDEDDEDEDEDQKQQTKILGSGESLQEVTQRVSYDKLHMLVSKTTKLWQLRHTDFIDEQTDRCNLDSPIEVMKDPVRTLAMWSVLTGRFKLTPHLLRQEPYDLIPQALLMAKLLRCLSILRSIEDVYRNKAINMANTCEGIAIQALRRIKEFDTSQNNILTMEYLRLPLRSYGDYDAIDLAARGESSSFVTIDVVQDTLDMFWYSDFFFVRSNVWKMEGAILMGFVPPLMLLLPLIMERFRKESPTFKNPEILQDSKFVQVKSALHSHNEHHGHEMTGAEERLLPQPPEAEVPPKKPSYVRRVFKELNAFYDIPCVKFRFHVTAHVMFVLLLSFVVMRLFNKRMSVSECICYVCLLGFLVEEINEIFKSKKDESLASYFSDGWNLIDLTAILCGIISFALRLDDEISGKSEHAESVRYWALVLLSTTCLVYWIRLLFVSVILESLGPKLKMMALMVKKDFLPFLYILFILMIGFGVVFQALLYPPTNFGTSSLSPGDTDNGTEAQEIAVRMFRTTFFMIVGEYGLDDKTNLCSSPDAKEDCVHETGSLLVTNIFMVIYIVIVQILLLNVIVAMFSETIDAVNRESTAMWQFEKYDLTQEFFMRSKLPPPFNVLLELRRLIAWIIRRFRRNKSSDGKRTAPRSTEKSEVEVFLYYLYYQAISCRGQRSTFRGVVIDEEDLDEGNKIIFEQIKDIQKELKRLRKLETLVQKMSNSSSGPSRQLPPHRQLAALAENQDT